MIVESLICFILLALYCFIQYYLKPKRKANFLINKFEQRGYRVYKRSFIPFLNTSILGVMKDQKSGDGMKTFKEIMPKYDVDLGFLNNKVRLGLMNPKLIKEFMMAENTYAFQKHQLASQSFQRVIGHGLVLSERQDWKKKRRIISNVFNFDFVALIAPRIAEIYEKVLISCEQKCQSAKTGEIEYNLSNFTSDASMRIILECFLGCQSHNLQIQGQNLSNFIIDIMNDTTKQSMDPLTFILGLWFVKMGIREKDKDVNRKLKIYHEWSKQYIHQKIKKFQQKYNDAPSLKPKDLIEILVVQNIKGQAQNKLENMFTEEEIIDEFRTFLMVGTDTTSHYLQMMIFYISKHPDVEQKVRNEIVEHMKDQDFSVSNLKKFKYIEAVMKETTRIYGPANLSIMREAVKDVLIDQIPIPKGTYLIYHSSPIHYNPDIYHKPFQFRPQRWVNGECTNLDPYNHIGFSAGPRSCIGRQLALLQAQIGLIKFLQRYESFSIPQEKLKMYLKFVYCSEQFRIQAKLNKPDPQQ